MPPSLEYSRGEGPGRSRALLAFVCAVFSGPTAWGLAVLSAARTRSIADDGRLVLLIVVPAVVLSGAFAFGCVVRAKLPPGAPPRSRWFANAAVAVPPLWGVAMAVYILEGMSRA